MMTRIFLYIVYFSVFYICYDYNVIIKIFRVCDGSYMFDVPICDAQVKYNNNSLQYSYIFWRQLPLYSVMTYVHSKIRVKENMILPSIRCCFHIFPAST